MDEDEVKKELEEHDIIQKAITDLGPREFVVAAVGLFSVCITRGFDEAIYFLLVGLAGIAIWIALMMIFISNRRKTVSTNKTTAERRRDIINKILKK